ncbi:MAG: ZIP family metal transporter [Candidatus Bathyarchaeia archaeon]|nr:ZIP family metal transporter [Candidatus Bathyarchaeia archaeon]
MLASVTAVSLISLIGILFIGLKEAFLRRVLMALVGFSCGTLIGGAFIHLLPESLEETGQAYEAIFYYAIAGIIVFFIMEKFLYWRHCHEEKCPVHTFVYLNLIGDGVHNFIDGMIIAGSFIISYSIGIATTLAVIFHEIPQEIGDFGVLVYGGFSKWKALAYNFVSALTAVAGSLLTYYLASYMQGIDVFFVPFAAGGFIYIAATDLMPELHKRNQAKESLIQLLAPLTGIGLMSILKTLLA